MLLPVSISFGREIEELSPSEIKTGLQVRVLQEDLSHAYC